MMNVRLHPSAVAFGELQCCALRKATFELDHQSYITSFLNEVRETDSPCQISILLEIFEKTARFVFIPRQIHRSFYLGLAVREMELIRRRKDTNLDCGHSAKEHQKALGDIYAKMVYPQGDN
ncbi:MAG: hypothetical protein Q8P97_00925 [bacterium]|nr:hypothetical protein [bacterium]